MRAPSRVGAAGLLGAAIVLVAIALLWRPSPASRPGASDSGSMSGGQATGFIRSSPVGDQTSPPSLGPTAAGPVPTGMPVIANVVLPDAPEVVLFERIRDDIVVLGWRPGEATIGARTTLVGAARGLDSRAFGTVSADGRLVLVHAPPATHGEPDTVRVYRFQAQSSPLLWEPTTLGGNIQVGFASTDHVIVSAAGPLNRSRGWTLVDLAGGAPVLQEIDLPPLPRTPLPTRDLAELLLNHVPAGLSADGAWLYALGAYAREPIYRPASRVSLVTGKAEPIERFPTAGPTRIESSLLDPISGRLLLAGPYTTAGNGLVEAWEQGAAEPDFKVDLGLVFGAGWAGDGSVVSSAFDQLPGPFHFRVVSITADGDIARTFFEADGSSNANLVGIRDGFAVAYVDWPGSEERQLVVIRLSDGAMSAIAIRKPGALIEPPSIRP